MILQVLEMLEKTAEVMPSIMNSRRERADNALRSISHALNETFFYYRDIERGLPRDLEREEQLSKYWSAAAIPMRHIDRELAEKCDMKSEYWVNPDSWDSNKIVELGISLESVRKKYRSLITKR